MTLFDDPADPAHPAPPIPGRLSFKALREAVQECRACELWEDATQAVIGVGPRPSKARLMLVGEQPGDREDIEGEPFVGPAGRVLDEGLDRAGIARADAYVTNVVKHFRYKLRGKRRIHQTPERVHVAACRPWLDAELQPGQAPGDRVPRRDGGAGAAGLVGPDRARPRAADGIRPRPLVMITTHPSAILRQRTDEERTAAMDAFVADLGRAACWLAENESS